MKTEAQLARTELELNALEEAFGLMRYLGFTPKNDTWKNHCDNLDSKVNDALKRAEWWASRPPDYKFG